MALNGYSQGKRFFAIFLSAALCCAEMSGVLFLCTRSSAARPYIFTGAGLSLAELVMQFLGKHHCGRGFSCATTAMGAIARGLLTASLYNKTTRELCISNLTAAYIIFDGLSFLLYIAFLYISGRRIYAILFGALLIGICGLRISDS